MLRQGKVFRHAALVALVAAVFACSDAGAAPPPKDLWATVNICDTIAHPNEMGVRASMPGDGRRRERMWMRFHAQFYKAKTRQWFDVKGNGVSPWQYVGRARVKSQQAGYTFAFAAPSAGNAFVLRGVVDFQWRVKRRTRTGRLRTVVVRTLHANTKGDHPSDGADPPGYTSGTCEIRSP
jgi:hypothetical protein